MIVAPDALQLIRARRKTRVTLPADEPCQLTPGRVYQARTVNADWTARELKDWQAYCQAEQPTAGRAVVAYLAPPSDAALQDPAPVKVTVVSVHHTLLGHVTQQDAQKEGHRFLQQFRHRWESTHGVWDAGQAVWVVSFYVGDLRDLFDHDRLLKATPGHHGLSVEEHQDYTSRPDLAMRGEPAAVGPRTLARYALQARERDEARKKEANAQRPRNERIRELENRAATGDQQAKRHLFMLDKHLEKAERRLARQAA